MSGILSVEIEDSLSTDHKDTFSESSYPKLNHFTQVIVCNVNMKKARITQEKFIGLHLQSF